MVRKLKKKNGPELQKDPIIWARHTVTRRCMNIYLQHLHKPVADPRLASSFILLAVQPTFRCTVCPIPNPDHTTEYTGSTWGGCCCRAGGGTGEVGNTWGPGSSTGWAHHLPITFQPESWYVCCYKISAQTSCSNRISSSPTTTSSP